MGKPLLWIFFFVCSCSYAQQVYNGGFEKWTWDEFYPRPEGWEYDHEVRTYPAARHVQAFVPGKSSDLSVFVWNAIDTITKKKYIGHLWQRVHVYGKKPQALRLFCSYALQGDTALISIELFRKGQPVGTGQKLLKGLSQEFLEEMIIPVTYTSDALPDTAVIHFYASILKDPYACEWVTPHTGQGVCNTVSVDNVELLYNEHSFGLDVYPNPVNQKVFMAIAGEAGQQVNVALTDCRGRELFSADHVLARDHEEYPLELSDLSDGIYFCSARSGTHLKTQKVVVMK